MALEEEGAAGVLLCFDRCRRVAAECSRTPCAQQGALPLIFLKAPEPLSCTQGSAVHQRRLYPHF